MKSCDEPKQQNENTGDRKQGANLGKKYMRKEKHTAEHKCLCFELKNSGKNSAWGG